MRAKKSLYILTLISLLVVFFQNCGVQLQNPFSSFDTKDLTSKADGGNGNGYDGKPDTVYQHYLPDFSCEGTPAAKESLKMIGNKIYLVENSISKCANDTSEIQSKDVAGSPFQNEFVSINDILFKKYDVVPEGIPDIIAELQCRDDFEKPDLEIIAHQDRPANAALARYYYRSGDKEIVQKVDFEVSRILSSNQVLYKSKNFQLQVDLSAGLTNSPKKFSGVLIKAPDAAFSGKNVVCILGGGLDRSGWPLQELTKTDTLDFQIYEEGIQTKILATSLSKVEIEKRKSQKNTNTNYSFSNGGIFFYDDNGPTSPYSMYDLADTSKELISGDRNMALDSASTNYFDGKLSRFMFFYQKTDKFSAAGLYTYSFPFSLNLLDLKTQQQYPLTTTKEGLAELFNLSSANKLQTQQFLNSGHLIYGVVQYKPKIQYEIRMLDLKSGKRTTVKTSTTGLQFRQMSSSQQIMIVSSDLKKDGLLLLDPVSNTMKTYNVKVPDNCNLVGGPPEDLNSGNQIMIPMYCDNYKNRKILLMSTKDGSVTDLGSNRIAIWLSPDKEWIMTADYKPVTTLDMKKWWKRPDQVDVQTLKLTRALDGKSITTPLDIQLGRDVYELSVNYAFDTFIRRNSADLSISYDGNTIFGFGGSESNPTLYRVDLKSGLSTAVCKNNYKNIQIGQIDGGDLFLFSYDTAESNFHFYKIRDNGCEHINSFPANNSFVYSLIATKIGFAIVVGIDPYSGAQNPSSSSVVPQARQVIFVPSNGGTPFLLSNAGKGLKSVTKFAISNNKSKLYLLGSTFENNENRLYSFDIK